MMTLQLLSALLISTIITFISILILTPVAHHCGLLDTPDHRKLHAGSIPLIGGGAMFLGISSAFFVLPTSHLHALWLLSSGAITLLGIWDDARNISVRTRLFAQTIITLIICMESGLSIENLGNLLNLGNIHLANLSFLISIFAVVGAINAFNMIDGIDGLAGSIALVAFGALAILFATSNDTYGYQISLIFIAVLIPYLVINLHNYPSFWKKVFMGDSGSMLIGLSVAWLLIYGSQSESTSFRPVTALWIIGIPLMDMAAIMFRRLRKRQSPFRADRNHLHHIFMRADFSDRETLRIITLLSIFMSACGIAGEILEIQESFMFYSFLILFALYNLALKHPRVLSKLLKKT